MDFGEELENLAMQAAFWACGFDGDDYPLESLGGLADIATHHVRTLAIAILLGQGDSDLFHQNLIRSGLMRETFLQRCQQASALHDYHRATSRLEPFLDAVTAGDLGLARQIAALSPDEWFAKNELQEDFCYARLLHLLILEEPPEAELEALLQRMESTLDGAAPDRLDVCRAIANREQDDFDEAFTIVLASHELRCDAEKAQGVPQSLDVLARRYVFIEGLALLRIADHRGLSTEPEYRSCPELARAPMRTPFPADDPLFPTA
jgi:hypothetical protein